ncbi:MAG: thrombospondin type-1 domain-containing protein [Microgenomates group bacterium]
MRRFYIISILLISLLFFAQQSRSANCGDNCRDGNNQEMDDGEWYLYWSSSKYSNINSCKNGNWSDWCCICEHPEVTKYHYPPICNEYASELSCPIPSPSASPTPSDTPPPTNTPTPTLPPVNCQWSTWSTCSVACGGGIQTRYHVVEAANGGNPCYGNYSQSCNTQECPRDCVWGAFGPCLKVGNGCAQTRTISVSARYGGRDCVGSTTQVCYACTDASSTAVGATGQGGIEITLYSGTNAGVSVSAPTPTQVQARNSGFNIFSRPTPTRIPPTPTYQPVVIPTSLPAWENPPQNPAVIPTEIPLPTPTMRPESIIPQSLASQTNSSGKVSYRLNTESLSEIKVSPLSNLMPTQSPLVPQEQRLLAKNTPSTGGLMVALQQKTGSQFITQQDELTVKRGNQFFSITNQATTTPQGTQLTQQKKTDIANPSTAQLEINANNVIAFSSMGLSVDPLSGVLTVETPNGPQKVSIMPDEALGIIIELKALNAGLVEPSILLVSEQGKLIYRITGERMEKFLGLLPIVIQKQILVSADTGSIIRIELSLLSRILSFFTF